MNNNEQWVSNWLKLCARYNIKPWKFDFKQFYKKEMITSNTSHLRLWIMYKTKFLNKVEKNIFTNKLNITELDPDKAAYPIYNILGWQNDSDILTKGDCMNSFQTTFTPLFSIGQKPVYETYFSNKNKATWMKICNCSEKDIPKLKTQFKKWARDDIQRKIDILEEIQNFDFYNYRILVTELESFASLTNSIGNFIAWPEWINFGRASAPIYEYWDLTLRYVRNLFLSIDLDTGKKFGVNLSLNITYNHLLILIIRFLNFGLDILKQKIKNIHKHQKIFSSSIIMPTYLLRNGVN